MHQVIAILDFGSQYTHLISRRLREFSVLTKIYPPEVKTSELQKKNLIGLILSGGPKSVHDDTAIAYDSKIFDLEVPMLGLCYGHQLLAQHFKGEVQSGKVKEYGSAELNIEGTSDLFKGLPEKLDIWMSHGDSVKKLPEGFVAIGSTKDCPVAAMANTKKHIYGLQFHPEVTHTKDDDKILKNFALTICKAEGDWKITNVLQEIEQEIKQHAQNKKVFMLVSGGVDSTVAFALLEKTLGKKSVVGLHIDGGIMRKNESKEVKEALAKAGFDDLNIVEAEDEFLKRLEGKSDPEEKRNIIGEAYVDVAEKWLANQDPGTSGVPGSTANWLLGQGTIYPDTIESGGTKHAETIKTHHNRIERIQTMIAEGRIIEPLKNFYKDEVREIGKKLGIAEELLQRHPFPGPGLGVMTLCSQKNLNVPSINIPDSLVLPVQSTGVQGDNRTYAFPLATWQDKTLDELETFATDMANQHKEINRVVKVLWTRDNSKKFSHTPNLFLTKDRLDLLRDIHAEVMEIIQNVNLYKDIWEFPIILLPVGTTPKGQSIVLRPASSKEVMTVRFFRLPDEVIEEIVSTIQKHGEIDSILYDVTNKPPGTMQWE